MKSILQSANHARQRAQRKAAARQTLFEIKESKAAQKQKVYVEGFDRSAKRLERKTRREDWMLGPLAPRRDLGLSEGHYGASSVERIHQAMVPKHQRIKYPLFVGDRVVILKGRSRGRIGTINRVEEDRQEAFLDDINSMDVRLLDIHRELAGHDRPFDTIEGSVALSDLRLVVEMRNPRTQRQEYVIVDKVEMRDSRSGEDKRFIAGTTFPLPLQGKEPPQQEAEHDCDTLRIRVEERTFTPHLMSAPMPLTVIDELRSKYSRWRKRFDPEFVEEKLAKDEAQARFEDPATNNTRTPLQELIAEKRMAAVAKPVAEAPSEDMLIKMGQLLAAKRKSRTVV